MHFANDLVDVRTKVALLLSEQNNLVGNNLEHQEDHATKLYMFINFMESMDEWISQVMGSLPPQEEPSAGTAAGGEQRRPLAGGHCAGGSGHCGRGCEGLLFSSSALQLAPGQLQQ